MTHAATQRPMVGAQVHIDGTGIGGLTNNQGRYLLPNVPAGEATVQVLLIGYQRAEGTVTVTSGETVVLDFALEVQALALDEIVVSGTAGQARRREVGNTITQINAGDIRDPTPSVDNLLNGRVAGMTMNPGHAAPGQGARIRLRGNVSVSQSNQPLVYIDGVRQAMDRYRSAQGESLEASPLNDVNPSDIERIEVLKGAAATTLYGTEASAGVIQIFTRRGAMGAASWTISSDHDLSWVQPFGSDRNRYFGMDPYLKTAYGHRTNLSVSGGTETVRYFLSGMNMDRDGVLPQDEEGRKNLRGNLTVTPFEALTLDLSASFNTHDYRSTGVGNSLDGLAFNAIFPHVTAGDNISGGITRESAEKLFEMERKSSNQRAVLGMTATWSPLANFTNRFTVGYDVANSHQTRYRPYGYINNPEGDISDYRRDYFTTTFDYVGTYDWRMTPDLRATLSVGGQLAKTGESRLEGQGSGLPGPGRQHTISATATRQVSQEGMNVNTGGFLVQSLFDIRDRYFVTLGLRVDGNSAFGETFGLQSYPKVSGSYVISDEDFWPERLGHLKLRGAYGQAGRAPGAFDAVRTWQPQAFLGESAFVTSNPGNPDLGPERTSELEFGFDASSPSGRVLLDFSAYAQRTKGALFPVARPPSTGFLGSQVENVGELTNRGIETDLDVIVIDGMSFQWTVGGSVATNRSEITDVGTSTSYTLVVGQPAPVLRGTKVVNANEIADPIYEQDAFIGPWLPTHTIGIRTSVELPRGISLLARGEYQGGHYTTVRPMWVTSLRPEGARWCDHVYEIVPWDEYSGPGDTHPNLDRVRALDRARCYRAESTQPMWYMPSDFFKIREVTMQAPAPFQIPGASDVRLTASVRNFFRWTNKEFRVFDPEMTCSGSLTALSSGLCENVPAPATATFSIRARF